MPANPNYKLMEALLVKGEEGKAELVTHLLSVAPELVRAHKFAAKQPKLKEVGYVVYQPWEKCYGKLHTLLPNNAKLYATMP